MRASRFMFSTMRETPADAEVISHQLMMRAGLIRKVASGLYNWLPLGVRVLHKVENIVREEMDRSGALEVFMPVVQPLELWQESGREQGYGPELLRFKDRHDRPFEAAERAVHLLGVDALSRCIERPVLAGQVVRADHRLPVLRFPALPRPAPVPSRRRRANRHKQRAS